MTYRMKRRFGFQRIVTLLGIASLAACGSDEPPSAGGDLGDVRGDTSAMTDADAAVDIESEEARLSPDADGLSCADSPGTGTGVGEVPDDVVLLDCDGNEVRLRDTCEARATWVFMYTGWCPPCQRNARDAAEIAAEFEGDDFAALFVITQTDESEEPSADYCAGIRERFGLEVPVLIDPDRLLPNAVGAPHFDIDLVMGPGNQILFVEQHAERDDVRAFISETLAAD